MCKESGDSSSYYSCIDYIYSLILTCCTHTINSSTLYLIQILFLRTSFNSAPRSTCIGRLGAVCAVSANKHILDRRVWWPIVSKMTQVLVEGCCTVEHVGNLQTRIGGLGENDQELVPCQVGHQNRYYALTSVTAEVLKADRSWLKAVAPQNM